MSRAATNRYAAIVLLGIAIISAVALKLSLNSRRSDAEIDTQDRHRIVYVVSEWSSTADRSEAVTDIAIP
jgi:hypothetical protein